MDSYELLAQYLGVGPSKETSDPTKAPDRYLPPAIQFRGITGNTKWEDVGGLRKETPAFAEELFAEPYTYTTKAKPDVDAGFTPYNSRRTYTNRTMSAGDDEMWTRRHEANHALANQNAVGRAGDYRTHFNKLSGTSGSHASMLGSLQNRMYELRRKYPELVSEFDKKYPEYEGAQGYLTADNFHKAINDDKKFMEIMAEMDATEKFLQSKGKDFSWEKEYPYAFTPKTSQAYRALSGLRQTVTDPKDIPAVSLDEGRKWYGSPIQQMNKR